MPFASDVQHDRYDAKYEVRDIRVAMAGSILVGRIFFFA